LRYGFKSILCINSSENLSPHYDRLNKFGGYLIEEKDISYQIMQRNGGTKIETAQTGQWTFVDGPQRLTIAKSELYAVANRLNITD
jgi:hypothetical protein